MKSPYAACHAPSRRAQHGFSLIEVLVSLLLLSFALLALVGLQTRIIKMSGEAEDRNRAALLADEMASEMWIRRSVLPGNATLTPWQAKVAAQLPQGLAEVTSVAGRTDAADIRITWRAPTRDANDSNLLLTRVILPRPL